MIKLEYFSGKVWISAADQLFYSEHVAWLTLGGDNRNYRTVDADTGAVLTDNSISAGVEKDDT